MVRYTFAIILASFNFVVPLGFYSFPENIMFISNFVAPVGLFFIWNFLLSSLRDILDVKKNYSNGADMKFSFTALAHYFTGHIWNSSAVHHTERINELIWT